MTLAQLRALVREYSKDTAQPYLASDAAIDAWLNEAEEEACLRARLLYETDDESITIVTDTADYSLSEATLSKRFFFITEFHLVTQERELLPRTTDEMQHYDPGWKYTGSGVPEFYITDRLPDEVTLWPTPSSDVNGDNLRFKGYKLPDSIMSDDADTPAINAQWHRKLIDWVLHQYYLTADADIFDGQASARYLAMFENSFGPRPSAKQQQLMYRKQGIRFIPRMRYQIYGT